MSRFRENFIRVDFGPKNNALTPGPNMNSLSKSKTITLNHFLMSVIKNEFRKT